MFIQKRIKSSKTNDYPMKNISPQVNFDSEGTSINNGLRPRTSKDRQFGKDLRHLLKLVTSAFLNPGEYLKQQYIFLLYADIGQFISHGISNIIT